MPLQALKGREQAEKWHWRGCRLVQQVGTGAFLAGSGVARKPRYQLGLRKATTPIPVRVFYLSAVDEVA